VRLLAPLVVLLTGCAISSARFPDGTVLRAVSTPAMFATAGDCQFIENSTTVEKVSEGHQISLGVTKPDETRRCVTAGDTSGSNGGTFYAMWGAILASLITLLAPLVGL
jgi:hypothetical protein